MQPKKQTCSKVHKGELLQTFFDDLVIYSNQQGSFIKLKAVTNQTQVIFSKILLLNNNCQKLLEWFDFLEFADFEQVYISELFCINNQINDYGCLYAKSDKRINSLFLVDHSNFISNRGRLGSGVSVQNLTVKIANSKIMNNTATFRGGGFYFEEGTQRFNLESTTIIYNQVEEADDIQLGGNSSLNTKNFRQSLLLFNFAKLASNNINEIPTHLSLSINQVEMYQQERISENCTYQVLLLKPFKIISQDHSIPTNYLFIFIGQQLQNFELYNPQHSKYQSYITEFTIKFKNSMNEQEINFLNSTCSVQQQIFDVKSQNVIELIKISTISFNHQINSFSLGPLKFIMDPYQQNDKIYEILIYCKTEYQYESLAYRMRGKSFLCQLGEFYISYGCQNANQNRDFIQQHIIPQNVLFFDNNKFEAISSNKINLKSGFQRPVRFLKMLNYVIRIQIIVQEDGLSVMIFAIQVIQEDYAKNAIDIIQEGMDNSLKTINNWIVKNVISFQRD